MCEQLTVTQTVRNVRGRFSVGILECLCGPTVEVRKRGRQHAPVLPPVDHGVVGIGHFVRFDAVGSSRRRKGTRSGTSSQEHREPDKVEEAEETK